MFLQKTQVWFLVPTWVTPQLPVTSVPGYWSPFFSLWRHLHISSTHAHTHTRKQDKQYITWAQPSQCVFWLQSSCGCSWRSFGQQRRRNQPHRVAALPVMYYVYYFVIYSIHFKVYRESFHMPINILLHYFLMVLEHACLEVCQQSFNWSFY